MVGVGLMARAREDLIPQTLIRLVTLMLRLARSDKSNSLIFLLRFDCAYEVCQLMTQPCNIPSPRSCLIWLFNVMQNTVM